METFSALLALCAGNSPVTGEDPSQRLSALMFSLLYAWISDLLNHRDADALRRHRANHDVNIVFNCILRNNLIEPIFKTVNYNNDNNGPNGHLFY